jgi:rhodanese-related sulfurtransferase
MTMRPRSPIESIAPVRAANRFFSGKISLVDVRSDREYRAVRVPCATHIPLPQLRRRVQEIRTDRPVALLCRSGHRSVLAALIARRHGLEALSVAGGMRAWLTAGRPAVWPGEMTPEAHYGSREIPGAVSARTDGADRAQATGSR